MSAAMQTWRQRGYVPDSEDEDDEFDVRPRRVSPKLVINTTRKNVGLESRQGVKEVRRSTSSVWDVPSSQASQEELSDTLVEDEAVQRHMSLELDASTPQNAEAHFHFEKLASIQGLEDSESSSLSDIDEALASSPKSLRPSSPRPQAMPPVGAQVLPPEITEIPVLTQPQGSRTFRTRRPEQLHPYLTEEARYRTSMHKSGLQAVRWQFTGHRQPDISNQQETEESQDQEYSIAATQSSNAPGSSPPTQPMPPQRALLPSMSDLFGDDTDDDLPDLSNVSHPAKRRRIETAISSRDRNNNRTHARLDSNSTAYPSPMGNADHDMFDIPMSPPDTNTPPTEEAQPDLVSRFHRAKFRMPSGSGAPPKSRTQSKGLATPLPSSTARRRIRTIEDSSDIELPSATAARSTVVQSITVESNNSSSTSSEDSQSSDSSEVIKRTQKRIKGVLPASWLRLDQKSRVNKDKRPGSDWRPRGTQAGNGSPQKGVARPVINPCRSRSPNYSVPKQNPATALVLSSDSSSEDDARPALSSRPNPPATEAGFFGDDTQMPLDLDDVIEEDNIDAMLPSAPRNSIPRKRDKRRQPKITESLQPPKKAQRLSHGQPRRKESSSRTQGQTSTRHKLKTSVPKQRAPQLGILDTLPKATLPAFLRVAARSARQQPEKARHAPSNKYIRLQTDQDTEDANQVLRQWVEGKIVQSVEVDDVPDISVTRPNHRVSSLPEQEHFAAPAPPTQARKPLVASNRVNGKPRLKQMSLKPMMVKNQHSTASQVQSKDKSKTIVSKDRPRQNRRPEPKYRSGQLEVTEDEFTADHWMTALRHGLLQEDRRYREHALRHNHQPNLMLNKYLGYERGPLTQPSTLRESIGPPRNQPQITPPVKTTRRRRLRKRAPQRIDANAKEFRQPSHPPISPQAVSTTLLLPSTARSASNILLGLRPWGSRYPTDFDVIPLETGTYYHQSTFLGSGEFQDVLALRCRDMATTHGSEVLTIGGQNYRWGEWCSQTSDQIRAIFSSINRSLDLLHQNPVLPEDSDTTMRLRESVETLRTIARYISQKMSLSSTSSRESFVTDMLESVRSLFASGMFALKAQLPKSASRFSIIQRLYSILLQATILGHQIYVLAQGMTAREQLRNNATSLLVGQSKALLGQVLESDLTQLREFLDDNRRHQKREAGVRDDKPVVDIIIILHLTLEDADINGSRFWDILSDHLGTTIKSLSDVQAFEKTWYDIFTILPFLEIDADGLLNSKQSFSRSIENWALVKGMLSRLFDMYPETSQQPGSAINEYLRVNFIRCHNLMQKWGWRRCESMLQVMFDFFAKRNQLRRLRNETSKGSPAFLEHLHEDLTLSIEPNDQSFGIFLKLMGTGIRGMQGLYKEKQISNIVYRFIPLHNRIYRRDQELQEDNLDALRNHHNLLCTLYWASPPTSRPRLTTIRQLVDHTSSHRAACQVSVRAWVNLVRFQLSTSEPWSTLEPFADWCQDMVKQTITQFHAAATEAEAEYNAAGGRATEYFTEGYLRKVISTNQSAVLAPLAELLAGFNSAMADLKGDVTPAAPIIQKGSLLEIFKLFDASKDHLSSVMTALLNVVTTYCQLFRNSLHLPQELESIEDDSQEYGSWEGFDEFQVEGDDTAEVPSGGPPNSDVTSVIPSFWTDPLWRILSSAIGASRPPQASLLDHLISTWVSVASCLVQAGESRWNSYFEHYSPYSWSQLPDTDLKQRAFSSFFTMALNNLNPNLGTQGDQTRRPSMPVQQFVKSWLALMVVPEHVMDQQHIQTMLLFNHLSPDSALLEQINAAYVIRSNHGLDRDLSLAYVRRHRLPIILTVFACMQASIDRVESGNERGRLHQEYSEYIEVVQQALQKYYTHLKELSRTVDLKKEQKAYRDFVWNLLGHLKSVTDIRSIDRFFSDPEKFDNNPDEEFVRRLQSYVVDFQSPSQVRSAILYLLTGSSKAFLRSSNLYSFTCALLEATRGPFQEGEIHNQFSLRTFLIRVYFPTVASRLSDTPGGFITAYPAFYAAAHMLRDITAGLSLGELSSQQALVPLLETLQSYVKRLMCAMGKVAADPSQSVLSQSAVLLPILEAIPIIGGCLDICLRTDCDHSLRMCALDAMGWCFDFAEWVSKTKSGDTVDVTPLLEPGNTSWTCRHLADLPSVFEGAKDQILTFVSSLEKKWVRIERPRGTYWKYTGTDHDFEISSKVLVRDDKSINKALRQLHDFFNGDTKLCEIVRQRKDSAKQLTEEEIVVAEALSSFQL